MFGPRSRVREYGLHQRTFQQREDVFQGMPEGIEGIWG